MQNKFELLTRIRPVTTSSNPEFNSYSKRTPNDLKFDTGAIRTLKPII